MTVLLRIEHAATTDAPDGQPWPPVLLDHWHLINSTGGRSRWRRITLVTTDAAAAPAPVRPPER
jgi:hypothetical protein